MNYFSIKSWTVNVELWLICMYNSFDVCCQEGYEAATVSDSFLTVNLVTAWEIMNFVWSFMILARK